MIATGPDSTPERLSDPSGLPGLHVRLGLLGTAAVLYLVAFSLLRPIIGNEAMVLGLLPVGMAGWFFGLWAGLLAWLVTSAASLGITLLWGVDIWQVEALRQELVTLFFLLLGAYAAGRMYTLTRRLHRELAEHRRYEHDLKQASAFIKTTVETSRGGFAITDLQGNLRSYSNAFSKIWGLSPNQNSQQLLWGQFFSDKVADPIGYMDTVDAILQDPHEERIFKVELNDGRTLECYCRPRLVEGELGGLFWQFEDITEPLRKRSELEASQQTIRGLIDNSIDGITIVDEQGRIVEWNSGMERNTGISSEEILNRPCWEMIYRMMLPEEKARTSMEAVKRVTREAMESGNFYQLGQAMERPIQHADGTQRFLETIWFQLKGEKGCMLGSISRDVTQRKVSEQALMRSHEIARNILNAYPDTAVLVDHEHNLLAVNKAFAGTLHKPMRKLLGSPLYQHLPTEQYARWQMELDRVFRTRRPGQFEEQINGANIFVSVYPINEESSAVNQAAIFTRDITATRQREHELQAMVSVSSALRAALTPSEVYPIILDQVETLLQADGIGLILKNSETGEVQVEQARGAWTSLLNQRFSAQQATRGPILIMKEPYLNNNIATEQHMFQTKPFSGLAATAAAPLMIQGEVIGTLWIGRKKEISKEDVRILGALGDITANAVHRAQLYEQTRINAEHLASALEIGRSLAETLSIQEIYTRLADSLYRLMPNVCTVMISRFDAEYRQIICVYGLQDGVTVNTSRLPLLPLKSDGSGTQSRVIVTRQPLVMDDFDKYAATNPGITPLITSPLQPYTQSAVFVPLMVKGEVLGVLQLQSYANHRFKPADMRFLQLVGNTAAIAMQNAILFENLQQSHTNLTLAYEATLEGWGRALDLRDHGTYGHTNRVVELTVELGRRAGLKDLTLINLRRGAQLHDIGKMGVPDSILLKPGLLTEEEWKIMRMHPVYAYEMLHPVPEFRTILDIPYCHHEKWDGSGYPRGLKGEEIPIAARIFSVVDVWDALHSDRPYRPAWPKAQVVEYLREQSGCHFDPHIVDLFLEMLEGMDIDDLPELED